MENASKALLMVAGLLISILVISLLVFVANQMADYRKSESTLKNVTQLKDFNEQFTQYARDDLKGVDLISLVNKVVDYNKRSSGVGEINYDRKIEISIRNLNGFRNDYGIEPTPGAGKTSLVFGNTDAYTINATSNESSGFLRNIRDVRNLEEAHGLKTLDVLASSLSNLESAPNGTSSSDPMNPTKLEILQKLVGTTKARDLLPDPYHPNNFINLIKTYREYSEFKTSTFSCTGEPGYDGGQIVSMEFEYVGR